MGNLFSDNRIASILQYYRKNPNSNVSTLAIKLGVSERTIRNDIKQINEQLEDCAVIEGVQGKYSLHIFHPEKFREKYSEIVQDELGFNSPKNRMDYIFGRVLRSEVILLADDLAYEMNIGRTTFMNDLKKLRAEIAPYQITIKGLTSKGLLLHGMEMNIRNYVLKNTYDGVYSEYPLDQEISDALDETFRQYHFEKSVRESLVKFSIVMLDRFLTGHYIGQLADKYYNMTARPEFAVVDQLVNRFGEILHIDFPIEEKLFLFLPIVGMRTPADIQDMHSIALDTNIFILVDRIFEQIQLNMNIHIDSGEFTEEFCYHMMFMVNRLRFGVQLKNPMLDELKGKYALANEMSEIASKVIQDECGLTVSEEEKGYLIAYFGVFLTENGLKKKKPFKVAVVCGTGIVTARLIAVQLKKVLDSSAEISVYSEEKANAEVLNQYDIVLTTIELSCKCERPIIQIHEIFNEREILHKMEKAKYWDQIEIPIIDNSWFVMTGLLDEHRFFKLNPAMKYHEAVKVMADGLYENGDVDDGFYVRLMEREKKGMTAFDHSVAIPHVIQYEGDKIILAVGVCEQPLEYNERDVSIIFMIGLPKEVENNDDLLIRVYDEIIAISKDEDLLEKLCKADSFSALLRALYGRAGNL